MIIDILVHVYPFFKTCLKENMISFFGKVLCVWFFFSLLKGELFQMHEGESDLSLMDVWIRKELILCFVFDFFQCCDCQVSS